MNQNKIFDHHIDHNQAERPSFAPNWRALSRTYPSGFLPNGLGNDHVLAYLDCSVPGLKLLRAFFIHPRSSKLSLSIFFNISAQWGSPIECL
jgi:hypothetical protein